MLYLSKCIPELSITVLCLLSVAARNLMRFAICPIDAQWDLGLVIIRTND